MTMNVIGDALLMYSVPCQRCRGARSLASARPPECPHCGGKGVVQSLPPGNSLYYMAGAETLHHLLARLLLVIGQIQTYEADLLAGGSTEAACLASARRSGLAEVAAALDLWLSTVVESQPQGRKR